MEMEARAMRLPWVAVVALLGVLGGGTGAAALHGPEAGPTHAEFESLRATVAAHEVAIGRIDERLQAIQASLGRLDVKLDGVIVPRDK